MVHRIIISFTLMLVTLGANSQDLRCDSIRTALEYQRDNYPSSQFRDVYKNFMQDFFGPGHILADTAAAGAYLRRELAENESFGGPLYEPTGFRGNFYRVNLGLIKDGTVPYDVFFEAFVKSVQGVVPPTLDYWKGIWNEISKELEKMGWTFENQKEDMAELAKRMESGNFVMHHSKSYNDSVNFHYRIIAKREFEQEILPYLSSLYGIPRDASKSFRR